MRNVVQLCLALNVWLQIIFYMRKRNHAFSFLRSLLCDREKWQIASLPKFKDRDSLLCNVTLA